MKPQANKNAPQEIVTLYNQSYVVIFRGNRVTNQEKETRLTVIIKNKNAGIVIEEMTPQDIAITITEKGASAARTYRYNHKEPYSAYREARKILHP